MDPDLKLSRKEKNPPNTLENLSNDIDLLREILINLYATLGSYDHFGIICYDTDILSLMVVMVDVTFPIIQEQLRQFQQQRAFKNDNKNEEEQQFKQLLDANEQSHPSIVIATRLCLSITDSILSQKFKCLFDDAKRCQMGEALSHHDAASQFEAQQCGALKLCEFLNNTTSLGGFEELHIGARPFIEVGSFSRKLFGTFGHIPQCLHHLMDRHILTLSDMALISHLIGDVAKLSKSAKDRKEREKKEFDEKQNDQNQDNAKGGGSNTNKEDITKLLQIFPDHSKKYCRKLLSYFNHKFDTAVNAVLEGTVPLSIEAIDDSDLMAAQPEEANNGNNGNDGGISGIDGNSKSLNNSKSSKSSKSEKVQKPQKAQKSGIEERKENAIDPKLERYMKGSGRVLKKKKNVIADDDEFFDMFGFDGKNKRSMKKYVKPVKLKFNTYDDEVDDSYMQYFGFGVDDGESLNDGDGSDKLDFLDEQQKKDLAEAAEEAAQLNAQLNRHSYHFVDSDKPNAAKPEPVQAPPKQKRNDRNHRNHQNQRNDQNDQNQYPQQNNRHSASSNDVRNNGNRKKDRNVFEYDKEQRRHQYHGQHKNREYDEQFMERNQRGNAGKRYGNNAREYQSHRNDNYRGGGNRNGRDNRYRDDRQRSQDNNDYDGNDGDYSASGGRNLRGRGRGRGGFRGGGGGGRGRGGGSRDKYRDQRKRNQGKYRKRQASKKFAGHHRG